MRQVPLDRRREAGLEGLGFGPPDLPADLAVVQPVAPVVVRPRVLHRGEASHPHHYNPVKKMATGLVEPGTLWQKHHWWCR